MNELSSANSRPRECGYIGSLVPCTSRAPSEVVLALPQHAGVHSADACCSRRLRTRTFVECRILSVDQRSADVAAFAAILSAFQASPKDPLRLRRLTDAAEALVSDAVSE
jgi:hypothetical protein